MTIFYRFDKFGRVENWTKNDNVIKPIYHAIDSYRKSLIWERTKFGKKQK